MYIQHFPVRQLTKNFTSKEIYDASHNIADLHGFEINDAVVHIAQYIRDATGEPTNVNSAVRTVDYNILVGGAPDSQHLFDVARALDLSSPSIVSFMEEAKRTKNEHWSNMVALGLNGLGLYNTFVHVDTRTGSFAFWDFRTKQSKILSIALPILFILGLIFKRKFSFG